MKIVLFSALMATISFTGFTQTETYKYAHSNATKVTQNNIELSDPWAGGFNNPQFSTMDVNLDGISDLVVFERDGQTVKVFLKDAVTGSEEYQYDHESSKLFPVDVNDFMLLRDYNNDGKQDIFTNDSPYFNHGNGIKVYKNVSDTILKFELISAMLPAIYGSNPTTVFSKAFDLLAIDDIDGDGDLDMIAAASWYLSFQYFENVSVTHDSLDFVYLEQCWGQFTQSTDDSVNLNSSCKRSVTPSNASRHSGSTITTLDLNGDGLKDALIGDPDRQNMLMVSNGGTPTAAHMTSVNYHYPAPTGDSIHISNFNASFHLDVNEDNRRDLIVAPNQYHGSTDTGSIWYYKNYGTDDIPNFQLENKKFLAENQIDVGTRALPTFGDISGDSIPDLLIGNTGYFQSYDPILFETSYKSQISYYKNIGTKNFPEFELQTLDLLNQNVADLTRVAPTLGDIDGDGDADLLFGETTGNIHYYKNIAPIGNEAIFVFQTDNFMNQNFGANCSPLLYDIDKDDKLDLLVGQKNGHIKLYLNQGSISSPSFTTTATDTLGGVYHYEPGFDNSIVPSIGDLKGDSNTILMVGDANGILIFYDGIDSNYLGNYTEVDRIKVSNSPIAPAVTNLNHSDSLELFVGEQQGGVLAFQMDSNKFVPDDTITSVIHKTSQSKELFIYPNPSDGNFTFRMGTDKGLGNIIIYDLSGKSVYQTAITVSTANQEFQISPTGLLPGVYLVTVSINESIFRRKLIIQ